MRRITHALLAACLIVFACCEEATQLVLPMMPELLANLSFANPFRQYHDGLIPGWEYGGAAMLNNDYVMLTSASPSQLGWIWAAEPVSMPSWEAEIAFHVGGHPLHADGGGMAFWFTESQGRGGALHGQPEGFKGIGVIFDVREADDGSKVEPFVVALLNGGTDTHLSESDQQVGVCYAAYRNLKNIIRARIAWTNGQLRVWLDLTNTGQWQLCIETVNLIDMARTDPQYQLPSSAYFGITGSTRSRADTHVVYSLGIADLSTSEDLDSIVPTASGVAMLDDELRVHAGGEDASHPDHVQVVGQPSEPAPPAALGEAMADAQNQAAHVSVVPPSSTGDESVARFAHELRGIEAAMWELKGQANSSVTMVEGVAVVVEHLSKQGAATQLLLDQLKVAVELLSTPAVAAAVEADAPATSPPASAETTAAVLETVGAAVSALDATGRSHSGELRDIKAMATALRTASGNVDARLRSIDGRVAELGSAVQQLQTSLHELASSESRRSRLPGLFVLCTCAQLLALAAFLFYKSANSKRHFL